MRIITTSFIVIALFTQCKKDRLSQAPDCVSDKINKLRKKSCPSISEVYEYEFQGQIVYVFYPKSCGADLTAEIVDENCTNICWLGGISGNVTCRGENFENTAKNKKLIWEED